MHVLNFADQDPTVYKDAIVFIYLKTVDKTPSRPRHIGKLDLNIAVANYSYCNIEQNKSRKKGRSALLIRMLRLSDSH